MKKIILDDEEKDILESYERGEWAPVEWISRRLSRAISSGPIILLPREIKCYIMLHTAILCE